MILPIDLHCHSTFSDGMANILQIEEKCLREGMGIMLTDHNEIRGSLKLYSRNNIITLPSIEAGTKEGLEFLIYFKDPADIESFYKRAIEPFRRKRFMVQIDVRAEEMLSIASEYDCFISLAHPYSFRKKSITFHQTNAELLSFVRQNIDAVETFNGNLSWINNSKAKQLYDNVTAFRSTVGSDGHNLESIGQVTADFKIDEEDLDSKDIYKLLHSNEFIPNLNNKISKIKTAFNIGFVHSRYFADSGKGLEAEINSEIASL